MITLSLADVINWGWLRIGPPYIYVNIDPVIAHLGPLALRWYGLMYVVGIIIALWVIRGYTRRKGISQEVVYRILWWCIAAGLIGGRLYFVIQQPNVVSYYLAQPSTASPPGRVAWPSLERSSSSFRFCSGELRLNASIRWSPSMVACCLRRQDKSS